MIANNYYSQELHGPYELYDVGDLALEEGGTIRGCQLAYATFGKLNAAKDNAILIPTWFSGTSKIMEQVYVGPTHALNPDKYFIIIVNQIGSGLSTSPHNTPFPGGMANFPLVCIGDDVRAQHKLITEKFGIQSLALVVGGSMGAQQTYEWVVRYPDMVKRAAAIAGSAKNSTHSFFIAETVRDTLTCDPAWNNGWYTSADEMHRGLRRLAKLFSVIAWSPEFFKQGRMAALGFSSVDDFITNFMFAYFGVMDPNDLLCTAWKWQRADVSRMTGGNLEEALGRIKAKTYVMPIETDFIFPPRDCEDEHKLIPCSEYRVLNSIDGHLALLGADPGYIVQVDKHLGELLSFEA
jgi:homoserine O-acetyltransferase